jgi:transcriptional regulator GlxA family with amidase domain
VERARRELELTGRSAKQIAAAAGFGAVETMNRAFRRSVGATPLQYRARFALRD